MAVNTSHPSLARSVSAVRRIVLLSSITRTFKPWSFVLLPVTVWGNSFLYLAARRQTTSLTGIQTSAARVLTYRYTPCYAMRVTFLARRVRLQHRDPPRRTYSRGREHNRTSCRGNNSYERTHSSRCRDGS